MEQPGAAPNADPLDAPARPETVELLHRRRLLTPWARDAALDLLRPPGAWLRLADVLLLGLSALFVVAGIVCFFAYNWARMGVVLKLGLPQAALVASAVAACWVGLDRPPGKVLAFVASFMVGVFLAVFGQIYQTGADAYELFVAWAVLILPWVVLARFAPLWLFWLAIGETALVCYSDQAVDMHPEWFFSLFAGMNLVALAAKEVLGRLNFEGFRERWPRWLILPAVLGSLQCGSFEMILDFRGGRADWIALLLHGLVLYLAWRYYRRASPDKPCLGLAVLSVCLLLSFVTVRLGIEAERAVHSLDAPLFLVAGLVILGIFALGAVVLRRTYRAMTKEAAQRVAEGEQR